MYYPLAIRESTPASYEADTAPRMAEASQDSVTNTPTPLDKLVEETDHLGVLEKDKTINQETTQDVHPGCDEASS